MASVADIICDRMIELISDAYARKSLNQNPQITTITGQSMSDAFENTYISAKNKFDDGSWPTADELRAAGVFKEAGKKAIDSVYDWAARPRTEGEVRAYQKGQSLTWWMPRKIPKYYSLMKGAGIRIIEKHLNSPQFISAGKAFAIAGQTGGGYKEALGMSADLHMRAGMQILHKTTVGSARASAMIQALNKFTGVKNLRKFVAQEDSKDVTEWLGTINTEFKIGLSPEGLAQIRPNKDIDVEIGYMEINAEASDFKNLKQPIRKMIQKIEKEGLFLKAWQNTKSTKALETRVSNTLLDVLAAPKNARVVKREPQTKAKVDQGSARAQKHDPTRKVPPSVIATEVTLRDVRNREKTELEENVILQTFLTKRLHDALRSNMNLPRLQYQTGRFANNVRVEVGRTPQQRLPSVKYYYMKEPYGVFDAEIGALPWATPERDPRDLIEDTIRNLMAEKQIRRFTLRRGN